jgi:hypothetical protein
VLVASALAAAVLLVPGLPDVADLVVATAVYLGAVVALRAVPDEIWVALRQRGRAE